MSELEDGQDVEADEILLGIAAQLGQVGRRGDIRSNKPAMVMILDSLACLAHATETVVRAAAVKSLVGFLEAAEVDASTGSAVVAALTDPDTSFALLAKASAAWYSQRVSATGLLASLYRCLQKLGCDDSVVFSGLLVTVVQLCDDATPMVKRSAVKMLGDTALLVTEDEFWDQLFPLYVVVVRGCVFVASVWANLSLFLSWQTHRNEYCGPYGGCGGVQGCGGI